MTISAVIDSLNYIKDIYGDLDVEIYHDIKQSDNLQKDPYGVCIDSIKSINVKDNKVYISNEFSYFEEFMGYKCSVYYYPEEKIYKGFFYGKDEIKIDFSAIDKYNISDEFHIAVDKYIKYITSRNLIDTYKAVDKILNTYDESKDDDEYLS